MCPYFSSLVNVRSAAGCETDMSDDIFHRIVYYILQCWRLQFICMTPSPTIWFTGKAREGRVT